MIAPAALARRLAAARAPPPSPRRDGRSPRSRRRRDRRWRARARSSSRARPRRAPSSSRTRTCTRRGSVAGDVLADEVGADRHLAVAAVDEHGDLDRARPAEPAEHVERDPHRASGREDVVDEHDDARRRSRTRTSVSGPSMRSRGSSTSSRYGGDVDRADRHDAPRQLLDLLRDAMRELDAARAHAHEHQALDGAIALEDLVRETRDGSRDGAAIEEDRRRSVTIGTRKSPPDRSREGFRTSEDRTWRGSPDRPFLTSEGQIKRYEEFVRPTAGHVKLQHSRGGFAASRVMTPDGMMSQGPRRSDGDPRSIAGSGRRASSRRAGSRPKRWRAGACI